MTDTLCVSNNPPPWPLVVPLMMTYVTPQVTGCVHKLDHWLEMVVPGAVTLQNCFPGQIVEYNSMRAAAGDDPGSAETLTSRDARIVCFPLYPKPHQLDEEWLLRSWERTG